MRALAVQHRIGRYLLSVALPLLFIGCANVEKPQSETPPLPLIQQIAQCDVSESALAFEKQISAEHGFRRFTKNSYRPVVGEELSGHEVRIINLEPTGNKIYVAGKPSEMAHHLKPFYPNLSCLEDRCQAQINAAQTLYIYLAEVKKAKDTTVIECTKPELAK